MTKKFYLGQKERKNLNDDFLKKELLYQLADDDFLIAYRGSEWLGLAPHIEEDVAFSSINQNTMGHASMYYQLLHELGCPSADQLAHGRKAEERKNAILVELPNGPGDYLKNPKYDWAFTVVRHYFYDVHKKVRLESLHHSSYEPLRALAQKVLSEQHYHLLHWQTWFTQLMTSSEQARHKMKQAILTVWDEYDGLLSLGPYGEEMKKISLIDSYETLRDTTLQQLSQTFQSVHYSLEEKPQATLGNGRNGEHTPYLTEALFTLSEVYQTDPAANW